MKREKNRAEELLEVEKRKNSEVMDINVALKNQIINSKGSIIAFHSIRKELFNLKTKEDVYKKILSYLGQIVDYENGSVFVKEGNNLLQVDKKGNGNLKEIIQINSGEDERFMEALQKKVPMEFPIDLDGKKPIFAAPLFYGDDISGFIEVSRLSYSTSKSYSFEIFKVISEEINYTLQRIYKKNQKTHNENYVGEHLYTEEYSQN